MNLGNLLRRRSSNPRLWILIFALANFPTCSESFATVELASRGDVTRILRDERLELVHHVRQISARDWASAGVLPRGRNITSTMVDPGQIYQSGDFATGKLPERQLLLAAKNARHEVLCFWQGSHGGPWLHVMAIERGTPKSTLIFSAIMNNDIAQDKWTWEEVKRHIRDNKMDVLISAEHPGVFDNRLP